MRIEKYRLIKKKLSEQAKPDAIGTLKRCDCEISNLLECVELHPDHKEAIEDLLRQVKAAISVTCEE